MLPDAGFSNGQNYIISYCRSVLARKLTEPPDHRVYAAQRHEIGAGWSQIAKSSGGTYWLARL